MRYSFLVGRIILVGVVFCVNAVCFADRIIYVDENAPGPVFDGLTWTRAYTILQFALDDARSGDVIYVAEGTYKPYNFYGGDTNPYRAFRLKNGVGLYGGFDPSSGVTTMEQRNWKSHKTILSGDLGWSGFLGDNCYHVFYHAASLVLNSTAILDGFIVSDGNAIGDGTHEHSGGGMYNDRCSPTIRNCTFANNHSIQYGGAIYNRNDANPTIENCTFSDNQSQEGGAVANDEVDPTITRCAFTENSATWNGGAIYTKNFAIPHVTDCVFRLNTAEKGGGAMYNLNYASPQVLRCTFDRNTAVRDGGAIMNYMDSTARIQDCVFVMNRTTDVNGDAGAIYNGIDADVRIINCLFYYNRSANGGAILNRSSNPFLNVCTFYANRATLAGGGMFNTAASPTVTNCIFWTDRLDEIYNEDGAAPSITYCDIYDDYSGTGNIETNPRFVRVPDFWDITFAAGKTNTIIVASTKGHSVGDVLELDNDGIKRTITAMKENIISFTPALKVNSSAGMLVGNWGDYLVKTVTEDFHLRDNSPCIDAGNNKSLELPDHDIDTQPRIVDGDDSGTATVDMGFDEYFAGVWFVDADATGSNNGTSWINAFTQLQSALNVAQSGESIWVAAGTYIPTVRIDSTDARSACFQLKNGVQIYGGFDPSAGATRMEHRDWDTYESILSGDLDGDDTTADNAYHVFFHPESLALTSTAVLDGVIIRHAAGKYGDLTDRGGGMYNHGCSPTIRNCRFGDNHSLSGGGMYNENCAPTLIDCIIGSDYLESGNSASFGAGIYNLNADPELIRCRIQHQEAYDGGGMYNDASNPIVTDCVFKGNRVLGTFEYNRGGGMYNGNGSNPVLTGCSFENNVAIFASFARGAGMFCDATSEPTLTDCRFDTNLSWHHGGALYCQGSSPVIRSTRFEDNRGDDAGGAVYLEGGSAVFEDCRFVSNQTDDKGGGMYCDAASPSVADCNFVECSANDGGGIVLNNGSNAEFARCGFIENTVRFTGGGIMAFQSSPVLTDCFFENNSSTSSSGGIGGGMHCEFGSNPELTRCRFEGNTADIAGGGLSLNGDRMACSAVLTDCVFLDNQCTDVDYGMGAAITATLDCTLTVTNSRFDNNQALGDSGDAGGGALQILFESQATITDCEFTGNSTLAEGGAIDSYGGGHFFLTRCSFDGNSARSGGVLSLISGDDSTFDDCSFTNNTVTQKGGAIYAVASSATYRSCTFSGNTAALAGGAMHIAMDCSPQIINGLFADNTANFGGAVSNYSDVAPAIINCTFWGNTADGPLASGGAIYNEDSASPVVTNCILWDDSPNEIYNVTGTSCSPAVTYSTIEGGFSGSHNLSSNPRLLDPANGNFHLSFDSPAVDSGNDAALPAGITTDLEGDERFVDGDGNGSATIDRGSFEFDSTEMGSFDGDFDVDLNDFGIFSDSWMAQLGAPGFNPDCDMFPADDKIDLQDLSAWIGFWLQGR